MLSCKEVGRTISSDGLELAHWRQKLSVQMHLLMCRHCRRYARQLRAIGASAAALYRAEVDEGSLRQLEESIVDRLLGNQRTEDAVPPDHGD